MKYVLVMLAKSQFSGRESWLLLGLALLAMLPLTGKVPANTLKGLLYCLTAVIATLNAVHSQKSIRLFWSFLALAFWAWSFYPWVWLYSLWMGRSLPSPLNGVIPVASRTVLMIAAVASRPHLKSSQQRSYRTTLNFLLLLFFWVFVYALILARPSYPNLDAALILRLEALYLAENFFLLAILGVLIFRAQRPWKSIYGQFLGASVVYILAAMATVPGLASRGSYPVLLDLIIMVSACWFVWIALQGRKLATQLEQSAQPDTADSKYASLLAMLAVVAIPMVGLWELFRTDEPYRTHEIRLFIVLLSVLFLAVCAFVQEYLTNRGLFSDVNRANEQLRLAMESGKAVGWEWDLKSGRNSWSGDLKTMFGINSDRYVGNSEDFRRFVHPEDRQQVAEDFFLGPCLLLPR